MSLRGRNLEGGDCSGNVEEERGEAAVLMHQPRASQQGLQSRRPLCQRICEMEGSVC